MPRQTTAHVDDPAALGRRLREARVAAGVSQVALAFPGCSAAYVSRIEAGARVPSLQVVRELAARLGVPERYLTHGDTGPADPAAALLRDAELALRLDHVEEAASLYARAAELARAVPDRARAVAGLGQVLYRRDDLAGAIERLEQALDLDPELWDHAALDTLGRAYFRSGETEAAIALFRRALERAEREHDPAAQLRFAVLLANALSDVAAFAEAAQLLARIVEDARGGDPLELARVHWTQARLHTQQADHEAAARHARRALELLDFTEHQQYRARAHHVLGFAELDAGRPEEALRVLEQGLALLGEQGTEHDRAQFHLEIARALVQLDRLEEAAALAMQTAAEYRSGAPLNVGRAYATLADAFAGRGEDERAAELYELAIEILAEPPTRYLADALARYGELLERLGRTELAFAVYKRGATLRAQLDRARMSI